MAISSSPLTLKTPIGCYLIIIMLLYDDILSDIFAFKLSNFDFLLIYLYLSICRAAVYIGPLL